MSKRKLAIAAFAILVVAAASLVMGASRGTAKSNATFKVAWILVGPHLDGGWSQAHYDGLQYVQKALGSKVQTTYKENVPEGPQTCSTIDSLVHDGNQVIFATSFGYQDCMVSEAKKYPNVKFEQATGFMLSKNLSEYYGAGEDAIYLSGIAAGAATKSGTIGYVVPFPIPEVIRHANAFALGAQLSHPGATIKLVWTHSWFDPAKEKKAAESLKAAGADVLGQNVDSPATGQYAKSANVPWVGYDSDSSKFAAKQWLTGAVYNWGPYYLSEVKAAMNGTWKSKSYWGSMKSGFAKLAPYGPGVSAATKALIAKQQKAIESGSFYEFQGPIYDQKGKLRVAKGKRMSLADIQSVNWLVKGIVGSPKG